MARINFDKIINRKGTYSAKWDSAITRYGENIIPLSVADMDIPAPLAIVQKLSQINNGIYGYTILDEQYYLMVSQFLLRRYHYQVSPDKIVFCPRIIQSIAIFIRFFTNPNDYIGSFTPSYSPITNCISQNYRQLILSELLFSNGKYRLNYQQLENIFKKIKVFVLINPHNPTGHIWEKEELNFIIELAIKYNVFIISDDVHMDFCFNRPHYFISQLNNKIKQQCMICTSPAKTFNLPGLEIANIIIENKKIREEFQKELQALGFHNPNYFSVPAIYTAYKECDNWIDNLILYINENRKFTINFIVQNLPQLKVYDGGGTFLLWINYQQLALSFEQLQQKLIHLANVLVCFGEDFGHAGKGFFRINIALPRSQLLLCLQRLSNALTP